MHPHLLPFAAALAVGCLPAQQLIVYDPPQFGTSQNHLVRLPTTMQPSPALAGSSPILPALAGFGSGAAMPGDATFDSTGAVYWYTNGIFLMTSPTPGFPTTAPLTPQFVPNNLVLGFASPFTGMALDPVANILYLANDNGNVVGVTPVVGTPIVVPVFTPGFAMGLLSGLEWDSITGTLLACDTTGTVYPFFPGGAPAGAPIPGGPLRFDAQDVAIDKTGLLNPLGVRSIWVVAGGLAVDITGGWPPIITGANLPTGLAFLPQAAPEQLTGCACGTMLPQHRINSPMVSGNAQFEIDITGVIPGSPVLMAIDFAFNPAFPLINTVGCGLGVLGTTSMMTNFTIASPGGNAGWPLSLALLAPGVGPAYSQALFQCPADPTGFALTNTLHLAVCGM